MLLGAVRQEKNTVDIVDGDFGFVLAAGMRSSVVRCVFLIQ